MPYLLAIITVVVLAVGFTLLQTSEPKATTEVTHTPADNATAASYADGTFRNSVTYKTPKSEEFVMNVSLTVAQGVVSDATITYSDNAKKDPNVANFEEAYKSQVVGKSLDTITLSRVGGASLTTNAFNQALVAIKTDATS